jgi:membrane protease YdiL (CAAX protease family)
MIRIRPLATGTFVVLAFALAWLVALPLWFDGGLANPVAGVLITLMMYTPALAVVIILLVLRPIPKGERLRFLGIWPLRPAKRVIWMMVIGLFGPIVVVAASVAVAALCGWVTLDLVDFSGYAETLAAVAPAGVPLPPTGILVLTQLIAIPVASATVNALFAFGEELGWRGFLVPALRPLGTWPALLVSGAIWGLWHAPVILLGYNFGRTDITGVLLMTGGCVAWGVLLGWLRLRAASVWPAVFAHGALNASAGLVVLLAAAGTPLDPALVGPLGFAGWIVCALVVVILIVTGQFRRQPELAGAPGRLLSPPRD